ncbi:NAD-dependent epimerase/dehydratase family protein [Mesorhizobium sp. CU2]|uniref:NAD-dependent epimerase/dehydratase family protein n=1 Tax=unclassified Mesorhizobium TaxID=325217 RepID=UPI001127AB10|nr:MULTISPECIES: NAD-dependent epimerase/dehydratase family protein [unclassified Mesorhizobium]TPN83191.1 NAD-dependent epimerase/dehydratase family protein [Mesorhizobium sp. CU3]TPO12203.1 NAD-dependent epimerase/dehydratase family protein [Mesorhizobium sp. CU2]
MTLMSSASKLDSRCLVTGASGVLGRAIVRQLERLGVRDVLRPSRQELDLLDENETRRYFSTYRPDTVIHLAATVFGLAGNMKNQLRAVTENSAINHHIFSAIAKYPVNNFFFAGTVASYPYPYLEMPLREDNFFTGLPHSGEFGYAMAKRHAYSYLEILCKEIGMRYTYGIFTNLYGDHDRFDVTNGHVIPSLVVKAHRAALTKTPLEVWGDGTAERDFLHAEDAARGVMLCLTNAGLQNFVNISSGIGVTIRQVTECIASEAGVSDVRFNVDRPVGIRSRVVDNSKLRSAGFAPEISLQCGLARTYKWYEDNQAGIRQ